MKFRKRILAVVVTLLCIKTMGTMESKVNRLFDSEVIAEESEKKIAEKVKKIDVFYIRHGESQWNKAQEENLVGTFSKVTKYKMKVAFNTTQEEVKNKFEDSPLTGKGKEQAKIVQKWFESQKENLEKYTFMFIASPLQRAFKTLMIAAEPLGIKTSKVIIDPHLREPGTIDCKTPLYSSTRAVKIGKYKIVEPNLETGYKYDLLKSVADDENPDERLFEFRKQKLNPFGRNRLSTKLFYQIFKDIEEESKVTGSNAVVIGGHSLVMKDGLASILSEKLTVEKMKQDSKKLGNNIQNFFKKIGNDLNVVSKRRQYRKAEISSDLDSSTDEDEGLAIMSDDFIEKALDEGRKSHDHNIFTKFKEEWKVYADSKLMNGTVLKFTLTFRDDENSIEVGTPELFFPGETK